MPVKEKFEPRPGAFMARTESGEIHTANPGDTYYSTIAMFATHYWSPSLGWASMEEPTEVSKKWDGNYPNTDSEKLAQKIREAFGKHDANLSLFHIIEKMVAKIDRLEAAQESMRAYSTDTSAKHTIDKFWMFVADEKSVALDLNPVTGELATRVSLCQPEPNNGPPPEPYTGWVRISSYYNGDIYHDHGEIKMSSHTTY